MMSACCCRASVRDRATASVEPPLFEELVTFASESNTRPERADVDTAMTVLRYKSAKYSIEAPLALGALRGGGTVDQVTALRSFGASRRQIYARLYLPGMLPLVITGLRLGMIFNILGVLLAEMYASQTGLGKLIFTWGESGNTASLTAGLIAISVSTIAVNALMSSFERRAGRYQLEQQLA